MFDLYDDGYVDIAPRAESAWKDRQTKHSRRLAHMATGAHRYQFGGGKGSAPPPPPDYSSQINAQVASTNQAYQRQADTYNQSVRDYNNSINQFGGQLTGLQDQFGGANINNVTDFGDWLNQSNEIENQLRYSNFNDVAPSFSPTISSYGQLASVNVPNLMRPDDSTRNSILSQIDGLQSQYDQLNTQRQQAVAADDAFRRTLDTDIGSLWGRATGSDIYADGTLGLLGSQYDALNSKMGTYQSALDNVSFNDQAQQLTAFNDWLGQQRGAYDQEVGRIDNYKNSLNSSLFDFGEQMDQLSIRDLDGINALDQRIADMARQTMGFQSPIQTDLSSYLNSMAMMDNNVDSLRDRRLAEDRRLATAGNDFANQIAALERGAPNTSLYIGSQFDQARNAIDALRGNMQNFNSELDVDFSNQLNNLAGVENLLDARFAERRAGIDAITGQAEQARQGAFDTDLWNEQAMKDAMAQIKNQQLQLNRYSGGQSDSDKAMLQSALDAIQGRMGELSDYRGGIENRAQGLLDQIGDTQFYNMDDVSSMEGLYNALAGERDQYNALQAGDELANIQRILGANRGRIQTDMDELAARQAAEAQRSSSDMFGIDRNYILSELENTSMTPEEYAALISRVQQQDPEFANQLMQQYGALFGMA